MSFSIEGKTAIVTGAANGVGLAIGRHFLECGANVMFADLDDQKLDTEMGDVARAERQARMFTGDLCQKLTVTNLLSATVDAFDRVDILVNAHRAMALSDPLDPERDGVGDLMKHNLMSTLRLTQLTVKRMISQAEKAGREGPIGSVINLSSIAAQRTQPELLAYSMTCAAVEQMTCSLAVALAPKGVRVNAVASGSVMSASLQALLKDSPEAREAIVAGTPMGHIASPDELVETVQFLASNASGFMTGQVLTLDGGRGLLDRVVVPFH